MANTVPVLTRGGAGVRQTAGPWAPSPRWSPEEERVFKHCLEALLRGDYFLVRDAAVACLENLRQLPGGSLRKLSAVHNRLNVQAKAAGRRAYCASWSKQEDRNIGRYAAALVSQRYGSTREAVDDCLREHERLRRGQPRAFAPRTRHAVWLRFLKAARSRGWSASGRQSNRYRTVVDVSKVGNARPGYLQQRRPEPLAINPDLKSRVLSHGCGRGTLWNDEEDEVVARYAQELAEGRCAGNDAAARKCLEELSKLPGRRAHTLSAVKSRVTTAAARLNIPRVRAHWTPAEKQIIDRYARAVLAGSYTGPAQAMKDCYRDFCRLVVRFRKKGSRCLGANVGRSRQAVQYQLVVRVRALGRHGRPLVRWTPPERRICDNWVRWFIRHCVPGRRHPMGVASEGLQSELAEAGRSRSISACQHRLRKLRLRRIGLA